MTTRVDFYQLSRDPVDQVAALLAGKIVASGARALVMADDADLRGRISAALWAEAPPAFLAHGDAGGPDDARQPVLLSSDCTAANGATMAIIADGRWREEALDFDRVLLLFDEAATDGARTLWRELAARDDVDNRIHKQDEAGRWREGR